MSGPRLLTKTDVGRLLKLRDGTAWDLCKRAGLVVKVGSRERVIEGDLLEAVRDGKLADGAKSPPRPRRKRAPKRTWEELA